MLQALAAAIVAFTMLYFRRLYTIDPNAVYRKALVALNTNPGVLEVSLHLQFVHKLVRQIIGHFVSRLAICQHLAGSHC